MSCCQSFQWHEKIQNDKAEYSRGSKQMQGVIDTYHLEMAPRFNGQNQQLQHDR